MKVSVETIKADFDRIAMVADDGWDHNVHYHQYLLNQIPLPCGTVLEIGCGTGAFSRLLAQRAKQVVAVDLSPQMICLAKDRSSQYPNIEYRTVDVMTHHFDEGVDNEKFDCIVSIATLHHLEMEQILPKIRRLLKSDGLFVCLDLLRMRGITDLLLSAFAIPFNIILKLIKTGRFRDSSQVRQAWTEHGKNDSYLTINQIREITDDLLPGAEVKKHLFWRYSIIWRKAGDP